MKKALFYLMLIIVCYVWLFIINWQIGVISLVIVYCHNSLKEIDEDMPKKQDYDRERQD